MRSTLISRNVVVDGRRTSLRLEGEFWEALAELCRREGVTVNELCTMIERRHRASSRTAAVRAFVVAYFRAAATPGSPGPLRPADRGRAADHAATACAD